MKNMKQTITKILLSYVSDDIGHTDPCIYDHAIPQIAEEISSNVFKWINTNDQMPQTNVGVLVFIPDEDGHITSGMWDIDNQWVLLDDYRVPECEVTHWMPLPEKPVL